ncbi:MAG: CHAD domain-containing protein [Polaromonas sp.]|uniref:CYTH and CHAD domain-containing protein n=1 Tax=Polaromonas sp. TaxID=1869339 RepID=UPI0027326C54|nr:CYTH and CHAD domain-containing protein [Polaromonas sp.]MDP2817014.1 CHAD domain-containing protein [Polaromonas sp.]
MTEFELKLEIPTLQLKALEAALRRGQVLQQRLQARYYDTSDQALAACGVVVRLRKEGRQWVQTAKAPGSRTLERLEHNVTLGARGTPLLDLARHDGEPVGERIREALKLKPNEAFPDLALVYETDIVRQTRLVRTGGALVELALDRGHVKAGGQSTPICELEIELKQGPPASAVALAQTWCLKHKLWLSSVSKSMKGQRLALGQAYGAAVTAQAPRYSRRASNRDVVAAVVAACLDQVLGNASEVAGGCAGEDHIHQLRVGLRRLRTALRELEPLAGGWGGPWEDPLADVFRALGQHRDRDYLMQTLQGRIEAAGGPPLDWQAALGVLPSAARSVHSPVFQQALLGLVGFVHAVPGQDASAPDHTSPKKFLRKRLTRLHKQVLAQGRQFTDLPEAEQHGLRKRLKRLRYLSEFAQALFARRKAAAYLAALKPLQDALGIFHDEVAALQVWQGLSGHDPRALFGVGWLSARREVHVQACQLACDLFARQVKPFWD